MKQIELKKENKEEVSKAFLKKLGSHGYRKSMKRSVEMFIRFYRSRGEVKSRKDICSLSKFFAIGTEGPPARVNRGSSENPAKENATPTKSMRY